MFKTLKKIVEYPRLTQEYPKESVNSDQFIGRPKIDLEKCNLCGECVSRCPSEAIIKDESLNQLTIHYDKCIFCTLCEEVCPCNAAKMTNMFELAKKDKNDLRGSTLVIEENDIPILPEEILCTTLNRNIKKMFGRSLNIREVDSGSCNGCDCEIDAMNNPFNDVERLGIHFVASPRHADMLLVTGTATRNMQQALVKTYNAAPDPKLVVAVGSCACSGGIFKDTYSTSNGIDSIVPVDVYIPGCPPRPQAIIYGILKALDRIK